MYMIGKPYFLRRSLLNKSGQIRREEGILKIFSANQFYPITGKVESHQHSCDFAELTDNTSSRLFQEDGWSY